MATPAFDDDPHEDSDYRGLATIVVRGTEIEAEVEMRGYREPIDGIFRWMGRIEPNDALTEIVGDLQRMPAVVKTPHGSRDAFIGDVDFWNRYRIIGKSTPPFHVATELDEVESEAGD
ncbi:flavin-containing monooxygenase [Gordonia araii NBRC 100433]|uniref:Flavin-containing monooxygenase n=1 Tax=Gordonia araii NBRC 100433 TaxID=1073574 RepID=G7GX97_9ACTN|nr:DUF4873 domain-containing protein [Gordonia araii]NNG98995.1 DUF4873 domain-containing protein [Gordonia araii NBRC 100433]GAB08222.1 flavin-containing monooxygenase [Gordonia araii NBRC 100433]